MLTHKLRVACFSLVLCVIRSHVISDIVGISSYLISFASYWLYFFNDNTWKQKDKSRILSSLYSHLFFQQLWREFCCCHPPAIQSFHYGQKAFCHYYLQIDALEKVESSFSSFPSIVFNLMPQSRISSFIRFCSHF